MARPRISDRTKAVVATAALQGLLGYALIFGLAGSVSVPVDTGLKVFGILPTVPPPPAEKRLPRRTAARRPEGAASPPNLRATPTEIVDPEPVIPSITLPPVATAPTPGPGDKPSAGAAEVPGPGSGSGGEGTGTGSGEAGNGDGGGGGTPPRWLRGRIKDSDYPREASDQGLQGTLFTRYVVGTNGRVIDCTVARSSGSAVLDETTCRLVKQRYRYKPARDAYGKRIPAIVIEDHSWELDEPEAPQR